MNKNRIKNIFLPILSIYIVFLILYSTQKLLEQHSFRQTQTALTTFWLIKNGFSFKYETPVVGYPWSIPFEFPLFQYIVALLVKMSSLNIDQMGRLVSSFFFIICVYPVNQLVRVLKLKKEFLYVFLCLYFSSPLYMFWSRTFMIESAALFFSFMAFLFVIKNHVEGNTLKRNILFILFSTIAILQKSTTAIPILFFLFTFRIFDLINKKDEFRYKVKSFLKISFIFAIPILIGLLWVAYTDDVKSQNIYGNTLTSKSLRVWNMGTLQQRFSKEFYAMIWSRIITQEIAGFFGLFLLIIFFVKSKIQCSKYMLYCLLIFILPLLLFAPLHLVHTYYQYSCVIFLIAALAYAITYLEYKKHFFKKYAIVLLTIFFVSMNYYHFFSFYLKKSRRIITEYSNLDLAVSSSICNNTREGSSLVVYGKDWGSEIAYYAQRKTFMVPTSFSGFKKIWIDPSKYMGQTTIDAFVFYTKNNNFQLKDILLFPDRKGFGLFQLESNVYVYIRSKRKIVFRGQVLHSLI